MHSLLAALKPAAHPTAFTDRSVPAACLRMLAAGCLLSHWISLLSRHRGRGSIRNQPATAVDHGTAAADAATIVPGVRQPGANPRADTGRAQARSPVSLRPRGVSAQHPRGHRAVVVLAADFPLDGCQPGMCSATNAALGMRACICAQEKGGETAYLRIFQETEQTKGEEICTQFNRTKN